MKKRFLLVFVVFLIPFASGFGVDVYKKGDGLQIVVDGALQNRILFYDEHGERIGGLVKLCDVNQELDYICERGRARLVKLSEIPITETGKYVIKGMGLSGEVVEVGSVVINDDDLEEELCTDSDATDEFPEGENYYKKGTVKKIVDGQIMEVTDNCISESASGWNEPYNLIEYTCKETHENINSIFYTCPGGCEDGACVVTSELESGSEYIRKKAKITIRGKDGNILDSAMVIPGQSFVGAGIEGKIDLGKNDELILNRDSPTIEDAESSSERDYGDDLFMEVARDSIRYDLNLDGPIIPGSTIKFLGEELKIVDVENNII